METKPVGQPNLESLAFEIANPSNDEALRSYLQALYWYFKRPSYFEEQLAAQNPSFIEVAEVINIEAQQRQMEKDLEQAMEKAYNTDTLRKIHTETDDLMHAFSTESPVL